MWVCVGVCVCVCVCVCVVWGVGVGVGVGVWVRACVGCGDVGGCDVFAIYDNNIFPG